MVGGVEQAQRVAYIAEKTPCANLETLGYHIVEGRVSKEGIGEAAFEIYIIRVLAGGDCKFHCQIKYAFVTGQLDRRGCPRRLAIG